ncbi:MAG: hypothetical protein B9S34_09930 [Opitutia bacterium Tous-C1TDCM]|nr:MAG: hypothetical protein B9S34_09930 [Opitutae bacterium Tous-C1TDCM]
MQLGVDRLFSQFPQLVRGKRLGLITNPTGVDGRFRSVIERFRSEPGVNLVALYGPEHGVRGNAQAGEYVPFFHDPHLGLPVFSLYGQSQQPPPDMLTNIDAYMRDYDTQHTGKTVERDMIHSVEAMVFDLQDVGTRVYTYVATMAYAMRAAAEAGIPFVVLDRPNPIGGTTMEGPILEYPAQSSFIGLYPVPLRHGLTAGELAQLFNAKFLPRPADLTVVPMAGWSRSQWFDETDAPWVIPSPNMPTVATATVYPGQVVLEGTNLSEGRGTTKPFEFFGAPWLDGYVLARELNALGLAGAAFRETWFTPTFSKFAGERCGGCQIHVVDRAVFRAVETTLAILRTIDRLVPGKLALHADYFDKVMGTATVRDAFVRGVPVGEIAAAWETRLGEFARLREPFLLYR